MRLDSLLVRAFHDFLPFFYLKECGDESFKDQRGILISTIPEMQKIVNHLDKIDSGLWHAMENTRFLLTGLAGMVPLGNEGTRYQFKMKNDNACGHFFDVVIDARAEYGRQGPSA